MMLEITLMVIGIGCILVSFLIKPKSSNLNMKIENISIDMYEQMNDLQKEYASSRMNYSYLNERLK